MEKVPVPFIYSGNGTCVAILTSCCPGSRSELHIFHRRFLITSLFTKNEIVFLFFMQFVIQRILLSMYVELFHDSQNVPEPLVHCKNCVVHPSPLYNGVLKIHKYFIEGKVRKKAFHSDRYFPRLHAALVSTYGNI